VAIAGGCMRVYAAAPGDQASSAAIKAGMTSPFALLRIDSG
jgi:hypothetical protein